MKISACWIVKDDSELKSLQRSVRSVMPYVDSVHITANGKEVDKIKDWCESIGIDYSYLKWNKDFSEQRNFNFKRVPKDTDYIYWQDADDVLIGGSNLKKVAEIAKNNGMDAVHMTYWYGCLFNGEPSAQTLVDVEIKQMRERLLNPDTFTWKKRLHETPVEKKGYNSKSTAYSYDKKERPMVVLHLGADRNTSEEELHAKMMRNKDILELELKDEEKNGEVDPRTVLYLMKIYTEMGEPELWEKCIKMGGVYLKKSGWKEERATCLILMARCYGMLGDSDNPIPLLHEAIEEDPFKPGQYLRLAEAYFNKGMFREMKHWLEVALKLDEPDVNSVVDNVLENKMLSTELMLKYYFNGDRDIKKAYKASEKLYELNPTPNNANNLEYLRNLANLDKACGHLDKLWEYLESIDDEKAVLDTFKALPQAFTSQPFAIKRYQKYAEPRIWGHNEICYYANFNQKHFEEWSPKSLDSGLGGSETAVIELSKRFAKAGYKVTVFGDPGKEKGVHENVTYLPWYMFNRKDKFNILIQWRAGYLAGRVSAKKFFIDLHDIWNENQHLDNIESIDGFFVKSEYHRSLASNIEDSKFQIISNGI